MDWSSFAVLVIAGTVGAWVGMRVSRYLKNRDQKEDDA